MDTKKLLLVILLLTSCAGHLAAQSEEVQQLAQLNHAGQSQQAYELASQMRSNWEGNPAFDVQYGIAAVDSGQVSEGIFALERALMAQPDNDYARLELARAYFALEQDDRAKREFQRVLANDPPREVRSNVRPYLDAIERRAGERRTTWSGSAGLTTGHDTNINASPDDDSFFIPLLGGVATLSNDAQSDNFARLNLNGNVTRPLTKESQLFSAASLEHRSNQTGRIDTTSGAVQLGYNRDLGNGNMRLALQASHFRVDADGYRNLVGINGSWRHSLSQRTALDFSAQLARLDYPDLDNKDSSLRLATLGLEHRLSLPLDPTLGLSLSWGQEDAEEHSQAAQANTERDILGLNANVRLNFSPDLQLSAGIRAQSSDYAGTEALFQTQREETNMTGTATLTWRAADNWLVDLKGSLTDNDSNIPITDYSRNQISLGARYLFR